MSAVAETVETARLSSPIIEVNECMVESVLFKTTDLGCWRERCLFTKVNAACAQGRLYTLATLQLCGERVQP